MQLIETIDFQIMEKKFWRPKKHGDQLPMNWVNPTLEHTMVVSLVVDGQAWNESVSLLKEKAFFMKWSGPWPDFRRVRNWYNKHWGEATILKTLPNGFYLVIFQSPLDKEWIMNSGPFF